MPTGQPPQPEPWFRSRSGLVLLAFLVIAGFFVVTEHTAHVLGVLPWHMTTMTEHMKGKMKGKML